ncbi:MAG: hypothetical protein Q7R40_18800 [Phaeospirillum sp.]|nr:hypothetical protein [Phaeospirillum sp.]
MAAGVATHSLDVLALLPPPVAIAFVIVGGVVALAVVVIAGLVAYWRWGRSSNSSLEATEAERDDGPSGISTELLTAFLNVNGEFAAQVGNLAKVIEELGGAVEEIKDTLTGCSTCPFHPNDAAKKGT